MNKIIYPALALMLTVMPAVAGRAIFDVDGTGTTTGLSVAADGTVAGGYGGGDAPHRGYLRHPDGSIETFGLEGLDVFPRAINDGGQVVGQARASDGSVAHGLLRRPDGTVTLIDFLRSNNGAAVAINASGTVTGWYDKRTHRYTYVRDPSGTFLYINVPTPGRDIEPIGINDSGTVVGRYTSHGRYHGFLFTFPGGLIAFDVPVGNGTYPTAIAADGTVVGYSTRKTGATEGFVRHPDGSFETITPEGSSYVVPYDINASHQIVGTYLPPQGASQGFLRETDGTIKRLALKPLRGTQTSTVPEAISDSSIIAGTFLRHRQSGADASFGFLWEH